MNKKKVDSRIKTLIDNSVKENYRSMFFIVGSKATEQVVNLHSMLTKAQIKSRPNILWCYKKELGFQSDDRSRFKKLKKKAKKIEKKDKDLEKSKDVLSDPFHLFIGSTDIRFCYFKETQNILGQTFGMLVLQDYEAITPNILARTIETVEGGGIIVFLLPEMSSLKQLYTMVMDFHSKFRSENQEEIAGRFNERFLLSLTTCKNCLVLDDQLDILPLSSHIKDIKPLIIDEKQRGENHILTENEKELEKIKHSLKDSQPIGSLIALAKSLDQANALLQFVEAISEKNLQTTAALTAGRGRGKSAALGLSISAAVAYGYSNIFVTSPTPENLKTVFDFILKGFDKLGYKDQLDYEIVQSTNPSFQKAIVRINIFKEHRQTIQYINPNDYQKLGQAELVVIDEAAAIPLPIVKNLIGPYLVFMSSTINGYEGTGRSLSLKLIKDLREKSNFGEGKGRKLYESKLEEPIRYGLGDPVEKWLNDLLCLDATSAALITSKCPHPQDCNLYYVNRDTLFSYNDASEKFLHNMMSLYVSSHYKNTPNDLQIMSDAPAHHLFVLLGPVDENSRSLPDIYCVIQVALEGKISEKLMSSNLSKGINPDGDLIPYLMARQFQDNKFGSFSGARVLRIATHPEFQKMGYGSRAIDILQKYYHGEVFNSEEEQEKYKKEKEVNNEGLSKEIIKPKDSSKLPPLLVSLSERKPEDLDFIGVSFGVTKELYNFWKKNGYEPAYLRLTANDLTGEHTCVVLKGFNDTMNEVINEYTTDFRKRFLNLLSFEFKNFDLSLVLSLFNFQQEKDTDISARSLTYQELNMFFTSNDIKRLSSYSRNLVDYHVIMDLIEPISKYFFLKKIPITASYSQSQILAGIGLQHKGIDELKINLPSNQILALFNKTIRKVVKYFQEVEKQKNVEKRDYRIQETKEPEEIETEVNKGTQELNDIFEKPLNEKKRQLTEKEESTKKKNVHDLVHNPKFKITGISKNLVGVDVSQGMAQIQTEQKKEVRKHHLKDPKEKEEEKEEEKLKAYKKGGKKKRKTKL